MGSKSNERPFRVDETSASVTVVRYLHDFSVGARTRAGDPATTGPRNRQDPSSASTVWGIKGDIGNIYIYIYNNGGGYMEYVEKM